MWRVGRVREPLPCLENLFWLALDFEDDIALKYVTTLNSGVDVTACADAGRYFSYRRNCGESRREINAANRCSLYAWLLGERGSEADRRCYRRNCH